MIPLGELRIHLDQMSGRIVSRLKDRSRFPHNAAVYVPGGVPIEGRSGVSLLQFALEQLETYHALLGRYDFPDQYPLIGGRLPPSAVRRAVRKPAIPRREIRITDELLRFYASLLPRLCRPGEDPDTFGETAYADADLLQFFHERINVGRYVAEAKLRDDPEIRHMLNDPAALHARLRHPEREAALLQDVRALAERYDLDPAVADTVFRWVIEQTLAVEVAYLMSEQSAISRQRRKESDDAQL